MANQVQATEKQRPARTSLRSLADPFDRLQDEMDRMFSSYFRGWNLPRLGFDEAHDGSLIAKLDVSETPEAVQVVADLPGMKEKDIDITLNDNALTIKGHRESGSEEKKKNYHRVERSYGEFTRRIVLPAEVDPARVDAQLKDGVLTITLQKTQKAIETEKKIPIKAA